MPSDPISRPDRDGVYHWTSGEHPPVQGYVVVAGVGTVAEVACELRTARVVPLAELLRRGGVWRWECEARSGASAREAL